MAKIRHFIPEKPNINLITAKNVQIIIDNWSRLWYIVYVPYITHIILIIGSGVSTRQP